MGASVRRRARTAERQIQALKLRLDGFSTVDVAARLAISQPSAWALIRGGLHRWLAQADGLAEQLFNIEFARLERERVRANETEQVLLAHLAALIKAGEFRLRISERMAMLGGLDRARAQESVDVETLAHN